MALESRSQINASHCESLVLNERMDITCDSAMMLPGWIVIQGSLLAHNHGCPGWLIVLTRDGELRFPLAVSKIGNVYEIVKLPMNVLRMQLEIMSGSKSVISADLCVRRVSTWRRYLMMWVRVLVILYKLDSARRHHVALSWWMQLRSLERSYRLAGSLYKYAPDLTYLEWTYLFDSLTEHDRLRLQKESQYLAKINRPLAVVLDMRTTAETKRLHATLESLASQAYQNFELVLVENKGSRCLIPALHNLHVKTIQYHELSDYLGHCAYEWNLVLDAGCVLPAHSLYWFVQEASRREDVDLIYSDHDHLDENGVRCEPWFKPDWSLEFARCSAYPGSTLMVKTRLMRAFLNNGDLAERYALLMDVSCRLSRAAIHHIPAVLWHLPKALPDLSACANTLNRHLSEIGVAAKVEKIQGRHVRVRYQLPSQLPKVCVVIPTRDRLDLLRPCVDSLLAKTRYPNFEILILDNQSRCEESLAYMREKGQHKNVSVLRYDKPFNYSAINNYAVAKTDAELICLLNNDTEVIGDDWLDEMVAQICQPGVGVVGAKLYFSDGRVQHAGDTVGPGGCANHLHGELWRDDPGYMDRAVLVQELSAVTGACLLTWRQLYQELGGLDEVNLPVAFNDVDYCLRVNAAGKRVIFTPYAELYHHESVSRGKDTSPSQLLRARREVAYMCKRWKHVMRHDPFYNPNLSYVRPDFSLSHTPRVDRPF